MDNRRPPSSQPMNSPDARSGADSTRQSLIDSALDRFGAKGYDAASTREIAAGAETNIGSIAYYFGGKEGLRRACAEFVVATIRNVAQLALGQAGGGDEFDGLTPDAARERLEAAMRRIVRFVLVQPQARLIVRFMLREIANPSVALDIIYSGVMVPTHRRLCRLWATATGENPESENVRLTTFSMIGQIFYFRIGQEIITRRMDWRGYGPSEADAIADIIIRNMHASLDANEVAARDRREQPE